MRRTLIIGIICIVFTIGQSWESVGSYASSRLINKSGFIEIEPISFYFHQNGSQLDLVSSRALLWYTFQRSNRDPKQNPLFVFFNGGPGSATSQGLLSYNTSRMSVDPNMNGGVEVGLNPVSWTRLGNLLYIDARQTGFSYNLMENPQDEDARRKEFDAQNFNPFFDAADFIRVVLRFLSDHPAIQKNPVIIVGESYGGLRSTVMLHILLNYSDYANGKEIYQDKALVQEIQSHYNIVFPEYKDKVVPPEVIAKQFGRQILIEPAVTEYQDKIAGEMFEQEGSFLYQIAREEAVEYIPCSEQPPCDCCPCIPFDNGLTFLDSVAQRDYYNYTQPRDWMSDLFNGAGQKILYTYNLKNLTRSNVLGIDLLYASNRANAYKVIDTEYKGGLMIENEECSCARVKTKTKLPIFEQLRRKSEARRLAKMKEEMVYGKEVITHGNIEEVYGVLNPWDRYFIGLSYYVNDAFYENIAIDQGYDIDLYKPRYGRMFLKNVSFVKTFITNAAYDVIVYSAATPKALSLHKDILEGVAHNTSPQPGVDRPGWMELKYKPGAFPDIPDLETRTIRFPIYSISCHSVPITQPKELFSDVSIWLNEK